MKTINFPKDKLIRLAAELCWGCVPQEKDEIYNCEKFKLMYKKVKNENYFNNNACGCRD